MTATEFINKPAPGFPYFTPEQSPPAGTASSASPPQLFNPLTIRGVTLPNRIALSPLCQYSAENGSMTPWHLAHLGGIFTRGPGLTIIEAAAVVPEGRITPQDVGIWSDTQLPSIARVVEFAHSQNQKIAIQLAHAGRKASMVAPWLSFGAAAPAEHGGWPEGVMAPSALQFDDGYCTPKELTTDGIKAVVDAYVAAAKRAISIGIDVIEIHGAHGYLIHSFLSPASNKRTDSYGGSFENRTRLALEIVTAVRAAIPEETPLFIRLSADDWLPKDTPSWTIDETCKLAPLLAERGVDLIDVSSGGLDPRQKIKGGPGYQVPFSARVREAVKGKALVSAVGTIDSGKLANEILEEGKADLVMVGRGFQKNPGLVWSWAEELGVELVVAHQIGWGFGGRGGKKNAAAAKKSDTLWEERE